MYDNKLNFIDAVVHGESCIDDIDLFIAEWHLNNTTVELYDYLGMTESEYDQWIIEPSYIHIILENRTFSNYMKNARSSNIGFNAVVQGVNSDGKNVIKLNDRKLAENISFIESADSNRMNFEKNIRIYLNELYDNKLFEIAISYTDIEIKNLGYLDKNEFFNTIITIAKLGKDVAEPWLNESSHSKESALLILDDEFKALK